VTQDPAPPQCAYSVAPTTAAFGSGGGQGTVGVTTDPTCVWSATANVDWISLAPPAGGAGNGAVSYTVGHLNGSSRSGTMTVAGQTVTITQQKD